MSSEGTNPQLGKKDPLEYVLQTAIIFGITLTIFWVLSSIFPSGVKPDSTLLFIALIPFIIWLILSGKITEITGPGGWGIKVRKEGDKPVEPIDKLIADSEVIQKRGIQYLTEVLPSPPNTLSFTIGKPNLYRAHSIHQYLMQLERQPGFRFIIFVDSVGKFRGIMTVDNFNRLLLPIRTPSPPQSQTEFYPDEEAFLSMLVTGSILARPEVITDRLVKTSTNQEALELMEKVSRSFVPVVDENKKYAGVVTQERIVRRIMLKLLTG